MVDITITRSVQLIEEQGFALVPGLSATDAQRLADEMVAALSSIADEAVALRNRAGLYGARNILETCPVVKTAWQTARLQELLEAVLGPDYGLVRGLYFDKPPDKSWSLPWHQDLTVAVEEHRPSTVFRRPTMKAGVPHVEASQEILARMLTLRIHLDEVTDENGPLRVLPGTHRAIASEAPSSNEVTIYASAGEVLAMRPLLFHASGASRPGTTQHRRVLHLEFAASPTLPDGYRWHTYER